MNRARARMASDLAPLLSESGIDAFERLVIDVGCDRAELAHRLLDYAGACGFVRAPDSGGTELFIQEIRPSGEVPPRLIFVKPRSDDELGGISTRARRLAREISRENLSKDPKLSPNQRLGLRMRDLGLKAGRRMSKKAMAELARLVSLDDSLRQLPETLERWADLSEAREVHASLLTTTRLAVLSHVRGKARRGVPFQRDLAVVLMETRGRRELDDRSIESEIEAMKKLAARREKKSSDEG